MHLKEISQKYKDWLEEYDFDLLLCNFEESKSLVDFLDRIKIYNKTHFTNERMTFIYFDFCNCFKTKVYNLDHYKDNNDSVDEWFRQ